jgi:hypothetical protein
MRSAFEDMFMKIHINEHNSAVDRLKGGSLLDVDTIMARLEPSVLTGILDEVSGSQVHSVRIYAPGID